MKTIGDPSSTPDDGERSSLERNLARWSLGLAGLFVVIGLVWTGTLISRRSPGAGSQDWPNTMGMVIDCEEGITTPQRRDAPHNRLTYRYDVDDRRYEGVSTTLEALVTFDCAEYPLGRAVRVYYAPWQPRTSTLTPGASDEADISGQLSGALLCLLAGIGLGAVQVAVLFGPEWMRARRENTPV